MKITYDGHSCFGIELKGEHVLLDPFISPSPKAKSIGIDAIPCDYIFLTHAHRDHMADVEVIAKRTEAMLVSNLEVPTWFDQRGAEKITPMNH